MGILAKAWPRTAMMPLMVFDDAEPEVATTMPRKGPWPTEPVVTTTPWLADLTKTKIDHQLAEERTKIVPTES